MIRCLASIALSLPLAAASLNDFQLPPRAVFTRVMPRYPNAWFYIDVNLSPSYNNAVKLVTEQLRTGMRLRELSPEQLAGTEGCDFEARIEHLQPWEDERNLKLRHAHAFHLRYYYTDLVRQRLERVTIQYQGRQREFFRFAATARYEVELANPNHPVVETCPFCGRTRSYRTMQGPLPELVHDPLGLELLFTGKVRGEDVRFEDWEHRPVGGIQVLQETLGIFFQVFGAYTGDKNTLRVGVVVITAK